MTRSHPLRLLLAVVAASLAGFAGAPSADAQAPPQAGAIRVGGARLLRDGVPWVPRGVQIVGLVAPDGALSGKYLAANAHFGPAELRRAIAMHADTIRFQVSEYGLDPLDPLYSRSYVNEVAGAVGLARQLGLEAIVSLQAQAPAGRSGGCPLPDLGAQRAWSELATMFGGDSGVMFELYNEPSLGTSPANWELWEYGGLVFQRNGGICDTVGMQTLIDDIRGDGAENVIIVPGLDGEGTLAGMPLLSDPSDPADPQLAYGIHYPSLSRGPAAWDREFGDLSAVAPVIVTEWYASSTHLCIPGEPAHAQLLLDYLASKRIGIVGFAFDVPGTIIADWTYAPTAYAGFACGVPGDGPGELLFGEFAGLARTSDGLRVGRPPHATDWPALSDPDWILSYAELRRLVALAPSLARGFFDSPRTFVIGAGTRSLAAAGVPAAIPTASFQSETALARAVARGALPAGTRAVLFDDEHWRLTPRGEQLHPGLYYRRAAAVAHSHGLLLIAAPATDLTAAIAPRTRPDQRYAAFLRLGIARAAAAAADVYDIQSQGTEADVSRYTTFVRAVLAQAKHAHPAVAVLAGISTNPSGAEEPARVLLRAVLATRSLVAGYWLNDPGGGVACPVCTGPYATVASALLRSLRRAGL